MRNEPFYKLSASQNSKYFCWKSGNAVHESDILFFFLVLRLNVAQAAVRYKGYTAANIDPTHSCSSNMLPKSSKVRRTRRTSGSSKVGDIRIRVACVPDRAMDVSSLRRRFLRDRGRVHTWRGRCSTASLDFFFFNPGVFCVTGAG